ncbi:MAG: response regulator [Sciscionella sp.]
MNGLRVVVADDQAAVREGLVTLLELLDDIEVVGAASDGEQALGLVRRERPDVVLMDLRMPGVDGVEATRRIHAEHPDTRVVVLTTFADEDSVLDALRAGALGYLTKDAGREQIAGALRAAAAGQAVLDPEVQARLLAAAGRSPARQPPQPPPDGLTGREVEVLELIGVGMSNRRIARTLFISEATVKTHINHLFAKIGTSDRAQASAYAHRYGFLAEPPEGP